MGTQKANMATAFQTDDNKLMNKANTLYHALSVQRSALETQLKANGSTIATVSTVEQK